MTDTPEVPGDKRALLRELKIDRASAPAARGRPLKWLVLIAILLGLVFVGFVAEFPRTAVPITTALARAAPAGSASASVLDATGYVVARRQATVSAKTTGKVISVLIEEGDIVAEDQLLAVLDDTIPRAQHALAVSQLDAARASLEELDVALRQAELDLDRTRELAERKLASQADLDRDALDVEALVARIERARREIEVAERSVAVQQRLLEDMEIRAPFAGIVVAKAAQPGEMISPVSAGGGFTRTGICTIVDMDSLEVEVDVNESYINRVYPSQPVQVTLNAYPEDAYAASVIAIIPTADRSKATVRVRVAFVERDARVLPDMGVRVAFLESKPPGPATAPSTGLLIPAHALASDAEGSYVYVIESGEARRRAVTAVAAEAGSVRVQDGLVEGERVVVQLSEELLASLARGDRLTVVN